CVAYRRAAVLTVRRRHPRQWRWRHGLLFAAGFPIGVATLVGVPLAVLTGGIVAEHVGFAAGTTVGTIGAVAVMLGVVGVTAVDVSPGLGAFAPRDRAAARTWA